MKPIVSLSTISVPMVIKRFFNNDWTSVLVSDFWNAYNRVEGDKDVRFVYYANLRWVEDYKSANDNWATFKQTLETLLQDAFQLKRDKAIIPLETHVLLGTNWNGVWIGFLIFKVKTLKLNDWLSIFANIARRSLLSYITMKFLLITTTPNEIFDRRFDQRKIVAVIGIKTARKSNLSRRITFVGNVAKSSSNFYPNRQTTVFSGV